MASEEEKERKVKRLGWKKSLMLYIHDLAYMLCIIVVLFLLVFRVIVVSGDSMKDTLLDGDYLLLLSSNFYTEPEYGDIIVVSKQSFDDGAPIVKRVIATEGQTVDIDFNEGIVYVDGVALDESYVRTPTNVSEGMVFPLTVDDNCVFVMGDNRNRSRDSRYPQIGLVDTREILGKAMFLILPGTDGDVQQRDFGRMGAIK